MSFKVMYYFTIACPTIEKTLEMIDKYVERGVDSIQLDMPSTDPFGETDFVKGMMKQAINSKYTYDDYMNAIRGVRDKHPDIDISIVVYPDVINAIGKERYIDFLEEINAKNNMIACGYVSEVMELMKQRGITYTYFISYSDPEYEIENLLDLNLSKENIVRMRTKRRTDALNRRYDTWEKRVKLVRESGIKASLYAVAEIASKEDMLERKNAGMDGAIVGNSLMRLWDDENALMKLLDDFQSTVE
jgi:tryptophan synthase alpha chain